MESETPEPIPGGNVPDTVPTDFAIAERHRAVLEAGGIDVKLAADFGIRTVENPIELPPDTSSLHGAPPGMLFPLPHLDGSITHQVRLDEPPVDEKGKPVGKYATQADHPAFATAWPTEQAKADDGEYRTVLIVEGTKQTLAAVCAADDSTLVLGIQGCWGWMSQQAPIDDFNDIVLGKQVVVAFDADVSTNPNVHRAAEAFARHLENLGAKAVRWLRTGDTGTSGLDDYLGQADVNNRERVLTNLLKNARKLPKLASLPGLSNQVFDVDLGETVIRKPVDASFAAAGLKGDVVFGALPRIVSTTRIVDDLSTSDVVIDHEVELTIPGCGTHRIHVADSELAYPSKWVGRAPGGHRVRRPNDLANRNRLENTIREFDTEDVPIADSILRTGWAFHDGSPKYVFPGGSIGVLGLDTTISSRLDGISSLISFPDPHLIEAGERDDLITFLKMGGELVDPTPLWVLICAALSAVIGRPPSGLVMLAGRPASGKTHLAKVVTSMLSPEFGPDRLAMATLEGTANAIASAGAGLHHCFVLVDDVHQQMDRNRAATQLDAISTLARRSYSGGSAGKRRLNWDSERGRVTEGYVDLSAPLVMMTSERTPDATLMRSLVERMLVISVSKEDTYKPGGADRLAQIAMDGLPNRVMSRFIRWMANQHATDIKEGNIHLPGTDMTPYLTRAFAATEKDLGIDEGLRTRLGGDKRLREVLAPILVGASSLVGYATEAGALSGSAASDFLNELRDYAVGAMIRHRDENLRGDAELHVSVLSGVKSFIASGDTELVEGNSGDIDVSQGSSKPVPIVGRYFTTTSGVECVALLPEVVIRLLRRSAISTTQDLGSALGDTVIRSSRSVTTPVRFGKHMARCLLVRRDAWDDAEDDA